MSTGEWLPPDPKSTPPRTSSGFSLSGIARFLIVPVSIAVTALAPYYGSDHWFVAVVGALGALGVYAPSVTGKS